MGEGDAGGHGSVPSRPPRGGTGQHSHWWGRGRAPPWGLGSQGSEVAVVLVLARQPVGGAQRHPVALVQPPHAVALVMHVVGDVLQILQVGPARGGSEEEGHQVTVTRTAPVVGGAPNPPTSPWGAPAGCWAPPAPFPGSPNEQVPQHGELAVRRVLHCKARQSGLWGRPGWGGGHWTSGTTPRHGESRQGCTQGCCCPPGHPVGILVPLGCPYLR